MATTILEKPKVQMLCGACGSTDLSRDAWGEGNVAAQEWALRAVFDHAHCHACHSETRLVEAALEA